MPSSTEPPVGVGPSGGKGGAWVGIGDSIEQSSPVKPRKHTQVLILEQVCRKKWNIYVKQRRSNIITTLW